MTNEIRINQLRLDCLTRSMNYNDKNGTIEID